MLTFAGIFATYLLECGQGMLYLLVAFEFYSSALTMEAILLGEALSLDKKKKYVIFIILASSFMLLQAGLAFVQHYFNKRQFKLDLYTPLNTFPLLGLLLFNISSTFLLIRAI